jgi:exodeoxyribonuclease VII large subunit
MKPKRRESGQVPPRAMAELFPVDEVAPAAPAARPPSKPPPAAREGRQRIPPPEQIDWSLVAPGETPAAAVTIETLVRTTRELLEGAFPPLWVRGEVSDFKKHRNGHWYFTLRDARAQVRCVVWARDVWRIVAPPDEGMEVLAQGLMSLYEARGDVQFVVGALRSVGDGLWRKAFDLTREKLAADGLLAADRKRGLPRYPRRVAMITSADGAALHDVVSVLRRRAPTVELVLVPAAVQGEGAPASLCKALARVARWREADLLIIGRGGGSREELWAFNDEAVARALAACPIPTISAVGHEVDVTLCDLVADLRAPTPSAAAEAAVPVFAELAAAVSSLGASLVQAASSVVARARQRLEHAADDAAHAASLVTERRGQRLAALAGRLNALSPIATLARGYAVAQDAAGAVITSASQVAPGDGLTIRLRDGRIRATADHVDTEQET